jgi:Patatin-like phospholipase
VVCREHKNESRYSGLKRKPVCLCSSKPCSELLDCLVCDAARATSAAPTFFPAQPIEERLFVDGGMEFNNPSHVIFHHYSESNWRADSKRASVSSETAIPTAAHGNLNFSRVRFVNIGTGTEPETSQPYQNNIFANLEPAFIRMGRSLKSILKESATNPENVADQMITLARVSNGGSSDFKYARFSADNGVYYIKMHKFRHLDKIQDLTTQYLQMPKIQTELAKLAREMVVDYLLKQRGVPNSLQSGFLSVPNTAAAARPQTPPPRPLSHPLQDAQSATSSTQSSGSKPWSSGENSQITESSKTSMRRSEDARTAENTPTKAVPARHSMDIVGPAEAVVDCCASRTPTLSVRA